VLAALSPGRSRRLWALSFLLPLLAWATVSYVPFVWHPMIRIADPGDVAWLTPDQLAPRADVARENAAIAARGGRIATGRPANPVFLPAPHEVARALVTGFTTAPPRPDEPWLHQSMWHSLQVIFWGFFVSSLVGVPLGILAQRRPRLSGLLMGVVGVVQTVPSLALLAFLIALLGTIGFAPALVALFVYGLLPIVRNTHAGLQGVPAGLLQAAAALGLLPNQTLLSVELPLALPTVLAGIKTAAVISVGTATVAAFVGAGGLGERIVAGLAVNDNALTLAGAVPAAALALLLQIVFEGVERGWQRRAGAA